MKKAVKRVYRVNMATAYQNYQQLRQTGQFSRRNIIKGLVATAILAYVAPETAARAAVVAAAAGSNIILGRPTKSSVAISYLSAQDAQVYIEYGYAANALKSKTKVLAVKAAVPLVVELSGLKAATRVYYRLRLAATGSKTFTTGATNSFVTARASGSTFSFAVQGDSHPERVGKMFNSDLYFLTMKNIASQKPDFFVMMGDDFSIDPLIEKSAATAANVDQVYATQRNWLSTLGTSVPIFHLNGNHEQAAAYLLDGTATSPAVLAGQSRLKYFPLPATNSFYSVDEEDIPVVGKVRDYYSWTWGDALFVTLDPYWHSKNAVDNVAGQKQGGGSKTGDLWTIGIGDTQYQWLKQTLLGSKAKYKFVFAHHVMGTGRGGVEVSTNYEWGGKDPKGKTTFAEQRPTWEMPIHDLFVKAGVNIFFQGHDHIFVHQERDGVVYQSMPNPADDTFSMFNSDAYLSGTQAPNTGHVLVNVSPTGVKVDYFLTARPQDTGRKNLQIAHTYKLGAK